MIETASHVLVSLRAHFESTRESLPVTKQIEQLTTKLLQIVEFPGEKSIDISISDGFCLRLYKTGPETVLSRRGSFIFPEIVETGRDCVFFECSDESGFYHLLGNCSQDVDGKLLFNVVRLEKYFEGRGYTPVAISDHQQVMDGIHQAIYQSVMSIQS